MLSPVLLQTGISTGGTWEGPSVQTKVQAQPFGYVLMGIRLMVLCFKSVFTFVAIALPGVAALAALLLNRGGGRYPPGHKLFL
jgi:hypothetical protein